MSSVEGRPTLFIPQPPDQIPPLSTQSELVILLLRPLHNRSALHRDLSRVKKITKINKSISQLTGTVQSGKRARRTDGPYG
jgi:hypothetical protein